VWYYLDFLLLNLSGRGCLVKTHLFGAPICYIVFLPPTKDEYQMLVHQSRLCATAASQCEATCHTLDRVDVGLVDLRDKSYCFSSVLCIRQSVVEDA
jgi:hypothetical protein